MNFLDKYSKKETISSLEILKQINFFREKEGDKTELRHDNLLQVIRDEFEEEIGLLKIQETPYIHPQNKQQYPMFELTPSQAKQVLLRESKFVRRAVIHYIEKLENEVQELRMKEFQRVLENSERLMIENKNLEKEVENFKYQSGDGKYLKAVSKIKWLRDYFYTDKKGFEVRLYKELILLSNEKNIPYDGVIPPLSDKEILVFDVIIYNLFKEKLDKDTNMKIMPSYRRLW